MHHLWFLVLTLAFVFGAELSLHPVRVHEVFSCPGFYFALSIVLLAWLTLLVF